jgi:RimJ/RimL family protein N-acetyltransferase
MAGLLLRTERLLLRPWRVAEAAVQRELWLERDPRVPPHRRVDDSGHPSVQDLEQWIRDHPPTATLGLLAVEPVVGNDVVGYCGLVDSGSASRGEPELAFELLRRARGRGYATEAAQAVLAWAASSGYTSLRATVWDWNTASRRVLAKLGFGETGEVERDERHGDSLLLRKRL